MSKECSVSVTKIPLDIMYDIMSRLPVNSLVRFKCLSKSCCSQIIDDPSFINLHQKRLIAMSTNTGTGIIFCNWEGEFLLVEPDSLEKETKKAIKLNLPWTRRGETFVVGTCRGLLCLANRENHQHLVGSQIFMLWNFSTGKLKFLPSKPAGPFKLGRHCLYGFGHDTIHDDYKMVTITQYEYGDESLEVMVYSLTRNEWTLISKPISQYLFDRFNIFSKAGVSINDGILYWMAKKYGKHRVWDCKIFGFDLTALEFSDEHIFNCHPNIGWLDLEVLGGRLFVCETRYFEGSRHLNIWVLEEKWSRIVMQEYREYLRPAVYSKNGCRLLLLKGDGDGELCWLDLDNMDELHHLKIPGLHDLELAYICTGSLVPL